MRFTVSFLLLANCLASGRTFSLHSPSNTISRQSSRHPVMAASQRTTRSSAAARAAASSLTSSTDNDASDVIISGEAQEISVPKQVGASSYDHDSSDAAANAKVNTNASLDVTGNVNGKSEAVAQLPRGGSSESLKVFAGAVPTVAALAGAAYALTALLAPQTSPAAMGTKLVFAGAVAGIISRTLCAPIEMVSTVMMCRGDECLSMVEELRRTWKAEGLRGMFKGNGANCLKVAPSRGTQFLVYEFVKKILVSRSIGMDVAKNSLHAGSRLFAGGVAGMVAAAIVYPLEVVKTMLTLYPDECHSIPDAIKKVFKTGGVGALYRGLGPTLVAMFPYVGVEFMVYETLKKRWEASFGPAGTVALLILGALGGAAAQASAHPLDVIRRRMQMQSMNRSKGGKDDVKEADKPYSNMFTGLYRVGTTEGWHVLFNGLGPACLEKIPSTAFGYYIYEGMKVALGVASV